MGQEVRPVQVLLEAGWQSLLLISDIFSHQYLDRTAALTGGAGGRVPNWGAPALQIFNRTAALRGGAGGRGSLGGAPVLQNNYMFIQKCFC